jgi:flagellar biosynthesis/type III secretory pathway chaperone
MQWNIDPPYDPMQTLQNHQEELLQLQINIREILRAVNDHGIMVNELALQNKMLLNLIKEHKREIIYLQLEIKHKDL